MMWSETTGVVFWIRGALLLTLSLCVGAPRAGCATIADAPKRQFDLPATAAEQSLKLFSIQSGIQVVFAPEVTDGVRANAVKGALTPTEAVERLLAGTPLRLTRDEKTGVLSVVRQKSIQKPPPEKNGQRAALTSTSSDRPGTRATLNLPPIQATP